MVQDFQDLPRIVNAVIDEVNANLAVKVPLELGREAPLYGRGGVLDSLSLVSLVIALEQAIQDKFGATIALADERAMSQERSPYRTVGSLVDYALALLQEHVS
jgi:acyl carrier protein